MFDFILNGKSPTEETDQSILNSLQSIPSVIGFDAHVRVRQNTQGTSETYVEALQSWEGFEHAASAVGVLSLPVDNHVARHFFESTDPMYKNRIGIGQQSALLHTPGLALPREYDFINYYGPAHHLSYLPYWKIMQTSEDALRPLITDKIVMVGLYSRASYIESAKDSFLTPYRSRATAGVEIHATIAGNVLQQSWIRSLSPTYERTITRLFVFIISLWILSSSPVHGMLIMLFASTLWLGTAYALFLNHYFVPGLSMAGVIFPALLVLSSTYYYLFITSKYKYIQKVFSGYLSPEMVAEIAKGDSPIELGGKRVVGTAMFTDIQGFTSMMEDSDPEQAVQTLNQYFSILAEIIHEHKGSLLKFLGDGMYVIWGASLEQEEHAAHAVCTAIAIQDRLETLRREGAPYAFHTRIGIHSGPMLAGNIGADIRYDYTAIGDSVNTAARLEPLNKLFGTTIIFSSDTMKAARLSIPVLRLGSFKVYGKETSLDVFTPLPENEDEALLPLWHEILDSNTESLAERLQSLPKGFNTSFWKSLISFYRAALDPEIKSHRLQIDGTIEIKKI